MAHEKPHLAIAMGDPAGIGPEIALKAALDARVLALCTPVLFGDRSALETHAKACGISASIRSLPSLEAIAGAQAKPGEVLLYDVPHFQNQKLQLGKISGAHGRAAVESAAAAIDAAMKGVVAATIACPQTEFSIKEAGIEFDGYPSFVARCTNMSADDTFLMVCFDDKRIAHATLHVSLARAIALITRERVGNVIATTDKTLKAMGIARPRIAVSGLNPHAGEHGMFGDEETNIIEPAIADARKNGLNVEGPFGADTMFQKPGYDAFVVMVHDQGHIAAKLLATNRTAGMTIGSPILFSSVAHGSALDIAGLNKAKPDAVIEAVRRLTGAASLSAAAE